MKLDHKKELERKIADLEESLSTLKDKLSEQDETAQHDAIDNLDKYLDEIEHKYSNLRAFWSILGNELKGIFSGTHKDSEKK